MEGEKGEYAWMEWLTFLLCVAVDLAALAHGQSPKSHKIPLGVSLPNTMVVFERAEGTSINLAGKSKG